MAVSVAPHTALVLVLAATTRVALADTALRAGRVRVCSTRRAHSAIAVYLREVLRLEATTDTSDQIWALSMVVWVSEL